MFKKNFKSLNLSIPSKEKLGEIIQYLVPEYWGIE